MVCDFFPLMLATKPTPQASCSLAGWYRPWAGGRPSGSERTRGGKFMAELTNIHLLRRSDNGLADMLIVHPAAQARPAQLFQYHEAELALRRLLVACHEL